MTSACATLMNASRSILMCIDVQTRLCPAMGNLQQVLKNGTRLIRGANILDIPTVVTEQYPKGLGPTIDTFLIDLKPGSILEKQAFSAAREPHVLERLRSFGDRTQIVIFGTEAHVCVLQTALDLADLGWSVFVVADALSSRASENERLATQRLLGRGIQVVSTEMVLFEWTEGKQNPRFNEISALVK